MEAGRVGRPHGLDGSFYVTRPEPGLLRAGARSCVDGRPARIERRAGTDARPILRLAGHAGRAAAEALRGAQLSVRDEDCRRSRPASTGRTSWRAAPCGTATRAWGRCGGWSRCRPARRWRWRAPTAVSCSCRWSATPSGRSTSGRGGSTWISAFWGSSGNQRAGSGRLRPMSLKLLVPTLAAGALLAAPRDRGRARSTCLSPRPPVVRRARLRPRDQVLSRLLGHAHAGRRHRRPDRRRRGLDGRPGRSAR